MKSWFVFTLGVLIVWFASYLYWFYSFGDWLFWAGMMLLVVGFGLVRLSGWLSKLRVRQLLARIDTLERINDTHLAYIAELEEKVSASGNKHEG